MKPWRRRNDNIIDLVRPGSFFLGHFAPIRIDAIAGDQLLPGRTDGDPRVDRHCTSDKVVEAVRTHGDDVGPANNRVSAPAHHTGTYAPPESLEQRSIHRLLLSRALTTRLRRRRNRAKRHLLERARLP